MDAIVMLLMAVGLLLSVWAFISGALSGGSASRVGGTDQEHDRVLKDLGPLKHQFTNYSPWRLRFGVLFIAIGVSLGLAGVITENAQLRGWAIPALGLGLIIALYVLFTPVSTLHLYARGLAMTVGKSGTRAVYYPDIAGIGFTTVTFTTDGVEGRPVAKTIVITLHSGGGFEVGNDFVRYRAIPEAIQDCMAACAATENLTGPYVVAGSQISDGTPEEVTVEARSPRHAREEALNKYGVLAESCRKAD